MTRLQLLNEFYAAPDDALFCQKTVAAVRGCSKATLERDRSTGTGVPFVKIGGAVRYRKADILTWVDGHVSVNGGAA